MIPKEKIDEVRDRANIVEVVSDYIPLTKKGANHLGLCPFHSEKTPSFTVSEHKKIFYCFGCNATGNAVTFLMKKEGLAFPDAVKNLARRYGIRIDGYGKAPDPRDPIYAALKSAAVYFYGELQGPKGAQAREYLKKRGYEGDILKRFAVGFAPDRWDGLTGWLKVKGLSLEAAEGAGLLGKKEKGFYDKFRGRIIFPIMDGAKRIVGFGGRALADAAGPKYLNSPETLIFKKGEVLYGLPQAKESIARKGSVIVVEGYFDLIALHKHGFTNSVATMGTALTKRHVRALKGLAGTVYPLFDADEAGKNAAVRSLDLFMEEDVSARAVLLEGAKDPDEFLNLKGAAEMEKAISSAVPLLEFVLREAASKEDLSSPEGKRRFFDAAIKRIDGLKSPAERGHFAGVLSTMVGIPVSFVYDALKPSGGEAQPLKGVKEPPAGVHRAEVTILKVLVRHPELFNASVAGAIEAFTDPVLKKAALAAAALLAKEQAWDASALLDAMEEGESKAAIADIMLNEADGFIESPERMLGDSVKKVLSGGGLKDRNMALIKRLEEKGRADLATEILKGVSTTSPARR